MFLGPCQTREMPTQDALIEYPLRVEANGEFFLVRQDPGQAGVYHYDWVSGPNTGYGFTSGIAELDELSGRMHASPSANPRRTPRGRRRLPGTGRPGHVATSKTTSGAARALAWRAWVRPPSTPTTTTRTEPPWSRPDGLALDQAASGEGGYDALGELPRLLEVRVAGEDEVVDAEVGVLADPLGDLFVRADQRGAGAAAHEADARPQVGCHLSERRSRDLPRCRSSIRFWPSDSLFARPACTRSISSRRRCRAAAGRPRPTPPRWCRGR